MPRLAILAALEALEAGDSNHAGSILLAELESGDENYPGRDTGRVWCGYGRRFEWPGAARGSPAARRLHAEGSGMTDASGFGLAATLAACRAFVRRYVMVTDTQADALALWIFHTHVLDAAQSTPYFRSRPRQRKAARLGCSKFWIC